MHAFVPSKAASGRSDPHGSTIRTQYVFLRRSSSYPPILAV
jgi:hypothetical protein